MRRGYYRKSQYIYPRVALGVLAIHAIPEIRNTDTTVDCGFGCDQQHFKGIMAKANSLSNPHQFETQTLLSVFTTS